MATDRFNGVVASKAIKVRCAVAAEANVASLNGEQTVEGIPVVQGDRVLLTAQTDPILNGIWDVVNGGDWTRAADWDGNRDIEYGTVVYAGQLGGEDKLWQVQTTGTIVIGSTAVTVAEIFNPNAPSSASLADVTSIGDDTLGNNITISGDVPVLTIQDTNNAGATATGEISFIDSGSTQLASVQLNSSDLQLDSVNGSILITASNGFLQSEQPLKIVEQAAQSTPEAGYGQYWVRDDQTPMFTDGLGNDVELDAGGGGVRVGQWGFDGSFLGGQPDPNSFRSNAAAPSLTSIITFDINELTGLDAGDFWGGPFGATGHWIEIYNPLRPDEGVAFSQDGTETVFAGYVSMPVTYLYGSAWPTTDEPCFIRFHTTPYAGVGTVDGQILFWDDGFNRFDRTNTLTITEDGTSIDFNANGTEFMRWTSTDGGLVRINEARLRMESSNGLALWGGPTRNEIFTNASGYLEFTAENVAATPGAEFEYPIFVGNILNNRSAPGVALGARMGLFSAQFSSSVGNVLMSSNLDQNTYPLENRWSAAWAWNNPTAAADPGAPFMRTNTLDFSTVTELYFADEGLGNDDSGWIWGVATVGDIIRLTQGSDLGRWAIFQIDAITDNTGWWTIDVTPIDHAGTVFINADDVMVDLFPASQVSGGLPAATVEGSVLRYDTTNGWEVDDSTLRIDNAGADKGLYIGALTGQNRGGNIYGMNSDHTTEHWYLGMTSDSVLELSNSQTGDEIRIVSVDGNVEFHTGGVVSAQAVINTSGGFQIRNSYTGAPTLPERALSESDFAAGQLSVLMNFSTSHSTTPAFQDFGFDLDITLSPTEMYAHDTPESRLEENEFWETIAVGDIMYIADITDRTEYAIIEVTSAPTLLSDVYTIGVNVLEVSNISSTNWQNNNVMLITVYPFSKVDGVLPAGTTTNASLRYDGAAWVEEASVRIGSSGSMQQYADDTVESTQVILEWLKSDGTPRGEIGAGNQNSDSVWYNFDPGRSMRITARNAGDTGVVKILDGDPTGVSEVNGLTGVDLSINNAIVAQVIPTASGGMQLDNDFNGAAGFERVMTQSYIDWHSASAQYRFETSTSAADPGPGDMRFDNGTPASVTNIYIDELSHSENPSMNWLWGSLSDGDLLILRSENDAADYWMGTVNGTPTDNTGWWTIPVTHIRSGTLFSTSDLVNISVQYMSEAAAPAGTVTTSGTPVNNQIAIFTDADTIEGDAIVTFDGTRFNIDDAGILSLGSTTGDRIEVFGSTYTIGIESNTMYFNSNSEFDWYFGGAGGAADMTLTASQLLLPSQNLIVTAGRIEVNGAGTGYVSAQEFRTASVSGEGYWLYGADTYGMYAADQNDVSHGGRMEGETSSDWNIYFSLDNGTNRGFVFKSNGTQNAAADMEFAIHPDGVRIRPSVYLIEKTAGSDITGLGQLYVNASNALIYRDEGGTETDLTAASGGNVSNTGTPLNNQIAIWTDATTIEGVAAVTYNGSSFTVNNDITIGGTGSLILTDGREIRWGDGGSSDAVMDFDGTAQQLVMNFGSLGQGLDIQDEGVSKVEFDTVNARVEFKDGWRLLMEETASAAPGAIAAFAQLWVDDTTSPGNRFAMTLDDGEEIYLGSAGIAFREQTNRPYGAQGAGYGMFWIKDTVPSVPMFTFDSDADGYLLNYGNDWCYQFSTSTASGDPGAGFVRFNSATPANVTAIYIDALSITAQGMNETFGELKRSDIIEFRAIGTPSESNRYRVIDAVTDNTGWWTIPVAPVDTNSLPGASDAISMVIHKGAEVLQDYGIVIDDLGTVSDANQTLDYQDGPVFELDLENWTANRTITLSNPPASGTYGQITVKIQQDGTAARTITWAGGTFEWAGGTEHTMNSTLDGISIFTFETWDGGTTWYAAGADYS